MTGPFGAASPRRTARIAGVFYVLTFLTGTLALLVRGRLASAAGLIAGVSYVAVTLLFYFIFKPVSRSLSMLAAVISLAGCIIGPLGMVAPAASRINPLAFFGVYCLLIGYLIFSSTFLPRILGVLMALGGLSWLTFASRALADQLYPYNLAPGIFGEGVLTLWLVIKGVNEKRWKEQAGVAASPVRTA